MPGRKRLFFDIETSPNLVYCWRTGYDLKITHDCIAEERAIICICWKWAGENRVFKLVWDHGDKHPDEYMLEKFAQIITKSDEAIGHNGDRFDIPWLRTRCLLYNIPFPPQITTIDTLKSARGKFYFNSNKLDYIGKFLGLEGKLDTGGFDTWKKVMNGDQTALNHLVKYCKQDVRLLEQIFDRMNPYLPAKTSIATEFHHCPECGLDTAIVSKTRTTAAGYKRVQLVCNNCGKYNTIAASKVPEDRVPQTS